MFENDISRATPSRPTDTPAPSRPQIALLGGATLSLAGAEAVRLERKAAGLLAYLALEGEAPRGRLAALLWPEAEEATARNNLAQALRRLRQAGGGTPLIDGQGQLRLAAGIALDLCGPDLARQAEAAGQRGELLAGLEYHDCPDFDDWLRMQRERLLSARLAALESLADAAEASSDLRAALGHARSLLAADPYCEAHHRRLMRLLWLAGDRNAALAAYRRCRESLQRELGVEPSAETLALERSILRGETPPLSWRAAWRPLPPALLRPPRLAERGPLLARMAAAWDKGQAIFIEGHPGVGKTRLMQEFLGGQGRFYTFQGRPGDPGVPYASIARQTREMLKAFPALPLPGWVRQELARVLPEGGDSPGLPADQRDRLRFFQALAEATALAVAAGMRRVAFDDLHLQDLASIGAAHFVCAQHWQPGEGMRMVFCFRRGELAPQAQALLATALEGGHAVLVRLDPLSETGTAEMLAGIDPELAPLTVELHRHSGGNPFFALETLRAMHGTGALGAAAAALPLPRKARDLLEQRLGHLSPPALQLARLAALAGGSVDPAQAERLLGLSGPELAASWAELAAAHLFSEQRFAHEIARRTVLDGLPESLRARLRQSLSPPAGAR